MHVKRNRSRLIDLLFEWESPTHHNGGYKTGIDILQSPLSVSRFKKSLLCFLVFLTVKDKTSYFLCFTILNNSLPQLIMVMSNLEPGTPVLKSQHDMMM